MGHRRGALACACAVVVASSLALSGAVGTSIMAQRAAIPALAGHDVLTVAASDGRPGRLYLVSRGSGESDGSGEAQSSKGSSAAAVSESSSATVATVQAGARSLPIAVRVAYSLDGPDVSRDAIAGASGLVGVHVTLDAARVRTTRAAQSQRMLVAFTVPTHVAGDVSVGDDAIVTTHGSDTVVARVMRVGDRLDCYMTAKRFTMGDVIAVSVDGASALAADAVAMGDGTLGASGGAGATNGAAGDANVNGAVGSAGAHQRLLDELTTLRDLERSLAAREIAAKQNDYDKAFNAYMTAYVTSYTNHLSGSIGTSTQLTALMGTAGELGGDTPLAAAVLDEANATDALASAHQHAGAADALEQVIRMVRAQGTDGLVDTLRRLAGEETTAGAEAYADGQTQLSQAMIPYSMAYTDAYTKHLSELTGGSSAGAVGHVAEANAATAREFGIGGGAGDGSGDGADAGSGAHAGATAKVDAAMAALAAARERTGAGSAYRQVLLRFASELDGAGAAGGVSGAGTGDSGVGRGSDTGDAGGAGDDGGAASGAGNAAGAYGRFVARGMATDESLSARAESTRLKHVAAAERKISQASSGDVTTTVIDENVGKTDAGDVMKFAGGVPGATGGKSGAKSGASGAQGNDAGTTTGTSGTSGDGASGGASGGSSRGAGDSALDGASGGTSSDASDGASGGTSGGSSDGASGGASAESGDADGVDSALMKVSPFVGMNGAAGGTGTRLTVDTTQLIVDTTAFGDAGALISALLADETAKSILSASSAQQDATRFLIINPGI